MSQGFANSGAGRVFRKPLPRNDLQLFYLFSIFCDCNLRICRYNVYTKGETNVRENLRSGDLFYHSGHCGGSHVVLSCMEFLMINRETLIHNFVCGIPIKWKDQKRLIRSVERFEGTSGHEFFVRFWDGEKGFIKTFVFNETQTPPMATIVQRLS